MPVIGNEIKLSQPVDIKNGKARKPASVNDLLGFHEVPFLQNMFPCDCINHEASCMLTAGSTETEILINGLFAYQPFPIPMIVDMNKGEAVIRGQWLGFATEANSNMEVVVQKANMDTQRWEQVDEITGTILEDGTIDFDEGCIMLMNADKEGYGWGGYGSFKMVPMDYYTIDLNDWNEAGYCSFEEGWISPILDERAPNQTLKAYTNKTKEGLYAFQNPYSSEIWQEINTPPAGESKDGWIVVNASNPDCVCVVPLVASGMWLQMSEDETDVQQFYIYNNEGYKYYSQDIWPNEQIDEYLGIGEDPG